MNKYILLIFSFFCNYHVCFSQEVVGNECQVKQRYLAAYRYIQADSINIGKSIHVMNATVMIHRISFVDKFEKYPIEKEIAEADGANYEIFTSKSQYSPIVAALGIPENTYADLILIFSDIKDNMLVAELVPRNKKNDEYSKSKPIYVLDIQGVKKSHFPNTPEEALRFTQAYKYLFLFNEDNSIKDIFRCEIIYG